MQSENSACEGDALHIARIMLVSLSLQSAYFSSMFSGNWVESNQSVISMEIPDRNVTTDGKY